ncbi:phosphonate ABC transporter ATP-binding protein [Piscinibacter sakaiensis]|uniref:phosphonate ABC transporter ATP-binding protein n=1 Tax=Piscinibacter sakaiensis TaxID=1547922 RepID=UPI003AAF0EA6
MTAPTDQPAVAISGLRCRRGGRETLAIDELQITAGERVGLIGPNGAGKSTLLRCLNGLGRAEEGELQVLGRPLGALRGAALRALRSEIGHVMQGLHLVARLSALENVLIGALHRVPGWRSWARIYPPADIAAAEAALQRVGLLALAATRADRLSGGERQKLAVARMLLQRPRLILADEPTASLDPQAATEICSLLVDAAGSATLITVVHSPALLPQLADRVIGLRDGRIKFDLLVNQVDSQLLDDLYRARPDVLRSAPDNMQSDNFWRTSIRPSTD